MGRIKTIKPVTRYCSECGKEIQRKDSNGNPLKDHQYSIKNTCGAKKCVTARREKSKAITALKKAKAAVYKRDEYDYFNFGLQWMMRKLLKVVA